jgi:F-type H+-transporting ATPase subunit delta
MKVRPEARRLARELFRNSLTEGRVDDDKVRSLIDAVLGARPRYFQQVLKVYLRRLRMELAKRHAVVETAAPLEPAAQERMTEGLQTRYGTDLTFEYRVTPALIGGARVRVGSDVWEASVRSRLAALREAFEQD